MARLWMMAIAVASAMVPMTAAAAPAKAFGVWVTGDGGGRIEIAPCGDSACGRIVGGGDPAGPVATDVKNPDRALRSRPLVGLQILDGFTRSAAGWVNGRIYDPNSGRTYRSELLPRADGTLELKGCVGPFCRSEIWRRAQ
ncbi:MAG: DUF2147 domain-containing protein [Hyphomonadaceae bacterium]|nr:DUF2147 domain-containing protein [Hyphomonadaceae bacterium]